MLRKLLLVVLLVSLNACVMQMTRRPFENLDQQIVRENFNAYKYALLNDLGREASELVSARTLAYYDEILALALHGSESQIKALPAFDKLVVLTIRHNIPGSKLTTLSAREVFAYGIREEWISKNKIAPFGLGEIGVYGSYATANVVRGDQNTDRYLEFRKENDIWRINLLPLIEESKLAFTTNVARSQQDENTIIVSMLETMSGNKVDKNIWQPVIRSQTEQSNGEAKATP